MLFQSEYLPIWAALMGGILAIGGNVVLQFVTATIVRHRERDKEFAESLKQILMVGSRLNDWADKLSDNVIDPAAKLSRAGDADEIVAIAAIHVPDLYGAANILSIAMSGVYVAALHWKKRLLENEPAAEQEAVFHDAYKKFFINYWSLYSRVRFIAKKRNSPAFVSLWNRAMRYYWCSVGNHRFEFITLTEDTKKIFICARCGADITRD
ncbi:MAG TPA: hypothetical protein VGO35_11450 [Gammaproteobacteria bacterium]|jgi:hypothetical protein|nr:hypothetical protein [Gammaproteobacteria bacterium]